MGLFLQIIGGVVLALVLLVIGFFLYLKIKFGKWLKLDPDQNYTPLRIHLNEDFVAKWMTQKEVASIDEEILSLGFSRGKSYTVPEMPGVQLTAYFKAPMVAVLYLHDVAGAWIDFGVESDEIELTVTNGPIGAATETRPEKETHWLKEHSPTQLLQVLTEKMDVNAAYKNIDTDNFREFFELAHRKDMAFRARNGGMSHKEFLGHVEEMGQKISDDDLHEAFVAAKLQEIEQWSETALEEYMEQKSEDEQARLYEDADNYFIVPYTSHPEAFISYLEDVGFVDEEAAEELAKKFSDEKDLFFLFDLLNTGRSPDLRAKQVGQSDYPLELKIFGCKYA